MIPTRRVIVGDGALAYREKGSGEPLLLLHSGFIADGMLPLLDQPLLQDHRMIAYHRRGYGNSDPAGGSRSISRAAEDAFAGAFGPGFRPVLDRALPGAWSQAVDDADTSFGVELTSLQEWPRDAADLELVQASALSLVHKDDIWPGFAQIHEALLSRIPHCEDATLDLPSHLLQIAEPLVIAEAISSFLANRQIEASSESGGFAP